MSSLDLLGLIKSLLSEQNGVFLGEDHTAPALEQSLTRILPQLANCGVGTLSIEITPNQLRDISDSPSYLDLEKKWPIISTASSESNGWKASYDLVKTAEKHGLKLIGHEKPDSKLDASLRFNPKLASAAQNQQHSLWVKQYYEERTSLPAMNERNEYAAKVISSQSVGKAIVVGGSRHSGKYGKSALPGTVELLFNPISHVTQSYTPLTTKPGQDHYSGLDARLDFPSIDYELTNFSRYYNTTQKSDGRFQDYKVFLPEELGELKAPSIPSPPTTIPYFSPPKIR